MRLAYSPDGGTTWSGPNSLDAAGGSELSSNVNSAGQGWATWKVGETYYAQSFTAADSVASPAPDTLTTTRTAGATTGSSITVPPGTVGETDRATIAGANASTATGTVSYALYSSPSCTVSSKVYEGTTVLANGVPYAAVVTTALPPGSYYWVASYSGNAAI